MNRENIFNDAELANILNRIAVEITKRSKAGSRCCQAVMGFKSIRSYDELVDAVTKCRVVFVLVTTTHCPYCEMFKPVFARVANEFIGKAAFIEANAGYVPEVAIEFEVYSTPTTVVVIDKRVADALLGYMPYSYFKSYVENVLSYAR